MVIEFLNGKLYLSDNETDPLVLLFLAILEKEEREHKNGYKFFTDIRDRFKLKVSPELEKQLKEILFVGKSL